MREWAKNNSMRVAWLCAAVVCASSIVAHAQVQGGPSFDCSKSAKLDELAICRDPGLSALDRAANAAYLQVKRQSGPQVANQMGRKFLALRAECRNDRLCILRQYSAIIKAYKEAGSTVDFPTWAVGQAPDIPTPQTPAPSVSEPPQSVASAPVSAAPVETPAATVSVPEPDRQAISVGASPAPSTVTSVRSATVSNGASSSNDGVSLWVIVIVVGMIGYGIYRVHRRFAARRAVRQIIADRAPIFAKKRSQTVYVDDYGLQVTDAWEKHKKYITNTVLANGLLEKGLSGKEIVAVLSDISRISDLIDDAASSVRVPSGTPDISKVFSGEDYERYCAEILDAAGWKTRLTKGSGDQGVDIIAELNGRRVALQCKFYSKTVGNRAVQEAIGAMSFERTVAGVVVSNAQFSRHAKLLANGARVLLLHHEELPSLEERLPAVLSR
jgi:uncharacterized protein